MDRTAFWTVALAVIVAAGPQAPAWTEPFDEDPTEASGWTLYPSDEPKVRFSTGDGFLTATIPGGVYLDHWDWHDDAVQLLRGDFPEDFIIETRAIFAGSGDPADPRWPPIAGSYQAGLMVKFSRYDIFYWGFYGGTILMLERSGRSFLCRVDPGLREVSLRVAKVGEAYSFEWRGSDSDPWMVACTQVTASPVAQVGLIFKTWIPLPAEEQTFLFDDFVIAGGGDAPVIVRSCSEERDAAWIEMPYIREVSVTGSHPGEVRFPEAPAGLTWDPYSRTTAGWIPDGTGQVGIRIEASGAGGTATDAWTVDVVRPAPDRDDEFVEDPRTGEGGWEFHEPQGGIAYSLIEDEPDSIWWRMEVPEMGVSGMNFDHWDWIDRAPQLRRAVDPGQNFVIETRVRIVPRPGLSPGAPFLSGLLVEFGPLDLFYWTAGQERSFDGEKNIVLERSGTQDLLHGFSPDLIDGSPVRLRIERRCSLYNFFWRSEGDEVWSLAGSIRTDSPPIAAGLIIKTFDEGVAFTADFDYFDILSEAPVGPNFLRGDGNGDGTVDLSDAIATFGWLFEARPPDLACMDAADANDDAEVDLSDGVAVLGWLFLHRPADLPPPGPHVCGPDETDPLPECRSPCP